MSTDEEIYPRGTVAADELDFHAGWRAGAACVTHMHLVNEGKLERGTDFADLIGTVQVDVRRMAVSLLRTGTPDDCNLADLIEREARHLATARKQAVAAPSADADGWGRAMARHSNTHGPAEHLATGDPAASSAAPRFYIPEPGGASGGYVPPMSEADDRSWSEAFGRL